MVTYSMVAVPRWSWMSENMLRSSAHRVRALRANRMTPCVFFRNAAGCRPTTRARAGGPYESHMTQLANRAAAATFLIGIVGFYLYTSRLEREARGGEPRPVLLLTKDVAPGQELAQGDVAEVLVPERHLDARRVPARDKGKVLGVAVENQLRIGDGLLWSDLRDGSAHQSLAAIVPRGQRAYSLPAKANPLGDLLQAGDRVDVLLERGGASELVLERVAVLVVGSSLVKEEADSSKRTRQKERGVIVSIAPEEAGVLLAAEGRGDLKLVLRHAEDLGQRAVDRNPSTEPGALRPVDRKEIEHVR